MNLKMGNYQRSVKHTGNVTVPLQLCLTSVSQKFDQTMANLILNVIRPKFWIETDEKLIVTSYFFKRELTSHSIYFY